MNNQNLGNPLGEGGWELFKNTPSVLVVASTLEASTLTHSTLVAESESE